LLLEASGSGFGESELEDHQFSPVDAHLTFDAVAALPAMAAPMTNGSKILSLSGL